MKILHCSDIHLGRRPVGAPQSIYSSKRYEDYFSSFEYVVDYALNNGIDVFIVSGDLFDRRELSPEVLAKSEKSLKRIKNAGIKMLVTEGNHDKAFSKNESWISYLSGEGYFHLLDFNHNENGYAFDFIEINGINFYGAGYPGSLVDDVLTELSDTLTGQNNVVIVHTCLKNGSSILPGAVTKDTIDLFKDKVIYMAGGHIHSRTTYPQGAPFFFIPGSLEYWDIGENGNKGFIVFDTNTGIHEYIDSRKRKKTILKHQIIASSSSEFKEEITEFIRNSEIEKESLVVLELEATGNAFTVDSSYCNLLIEAAGALKGFTKVKYLDSSDPNSGENVSLSIEEMEKQVIKSSEDWKEFSSKSDILITSLKKLKTYQLENQYSTFEEIMDNLLEKLMEGTDTLEN